MKIHQITESGYITDPKDFDPDNVEVQIKGYGVLTLSQIKNKIKKMLETLAAKVDVLEPESLKHAMDQSVLPYMIQAYVDATAELNTPQMKRKATIARKKSQYSAESYAAVAKHITEGVPFCDSIFRHGSEAYFETINLARDLHKAGLIETDWESAELLESEMGQQVSLKELGTVYLDTPFQEEDVNEAEYQGKDVELNKPKRGGSKKFYVYVKNPKTGKVKKVAFGADSGGGKLAVKLKDPKARKAFADRHNCDQKNDKTKAGYWSCRLPRYAKSLGLSGGGTWW